MDRQEDREHAPSSTIRKVSMNLSVNDQLFDVLAVSQFTLHANNKKGESTIVHQSGQTRRFYPNLQRVSENPST